MQSDITPQICATLALSCVGVMRVNSLARFISAMLRPDVRDISNISLAE